MLTLGAENHPCVSLMSDVATAMADERLPADGMGAPPQLRVDAAVEALREAAGELALADTAATVAHFAAMTITVDAAGHSSAVARKLVGVMGRALRLRIRLRRLVMPAALLAVGGLGVVMGMRYTA